MNNTDKLLSDIANDVVLAWLKNDFNDFRPEFMDYVESTRELSTEEFYKAYDKAADTLKELAAFFERTIK